MASDEGDGPFTKKDVHYGKGHPGSMCGECLYFDAPDKCHLVTGEIDAGDWCVLFSKRQS